MAFGRMMRPRHARRFVATVVALCAFSRIDDPSTAPLSIASALHAQTQPKARSQNSPQTRAQTAAQTPPQAQGQTPAPAPDQSQARTQSPPAPAKPKAPLFPPQDLGFFDSPDREQWQKPDLIMDGLSIADGSVVADLGAAPGWFAIRLARRVGPNGIVYAEDIQPEMIEVLRRRVQSERLTNVMPILGTATDPRLPSGLDAALIINTFPEIEDPVTLLRNVAGALKPQGRIGIVDFNPGGGGPGPDADERVSPEIVIAAANAAGLRLIEREPAGPFQFLLIFGKNAPQNRKP